MHASSTIFCLAAGLLLARQGQSLAGETPHGSKPLVALTNSWKVAPLGETPAESWRTATFDDSSWAVAPAPFYNENDAVPLPKNTLLALTNAAGQLINAFYFRAHFQFDGELAATPYLIATNYVDDGAVFYLNGTELGRLRMPPGPVTPEMGAPPAEEGKARVLVFSAAGLKLGENVLAVEVHQESGATTTTADLFFALSLTASSTPPSMADLVVWEPSISPRLEEWTFADSTCDVQEGLVLPGKRRLLRFTTETRNIGTADLVVGAPEGNPEFVFHRCHDHYHFNGFIAHRLVQYQDGERRVVASSGKASFALEDSLRWDPSASSTARFTDEDQGLQHGWADVYSWVLPGQWVDATGVPPGKYVLELELDP
ncbi:MAG: lysyl oxidase family protein [Verrucomicrobiota bacterium]